MSEIPAAGAFVNVLHEELRRFQKQKNIEEWECFGFHMDTYRVFERNVVIRLQVKSKWPKFLNDPIPIPKKFEFKEIWKDKHGTEFEDSVIKKRKITPDNEEIIELDWEKITRESNDSSSNTAVCYLVLSLPDEEDLDLVKKRVTHSSEDHGRTLEPDPNVDKIYNVLSTISWDKKSDDPPNIDDLPDPEDFSYNVSGSENLPSKIEHVDRVEYRLDIEGEGFEKERTKKTYVGISDMDIPGEGNEIKVKYEDQ